MIVATKIVPPHGACVGHHAVFAPSSVGLSSVPVRPCDFRSVGPSPSAFPLDVVGAEPELWESVVLLRPSLNVPAFPSAGKLGEASSYLRTDLLCFPPVSLVLREGVMAFVVLLSFKVSQASPL